MIEVIGFMLGIVMLLQVLIIVFRIDRNEKLKKTRIKVKEVEQLLDNEKQKVIKIKEQYIRIEASAYELKKIPELLEAERVLNKSLSAKAIQAEANITNFELVKKNYAEKKIALEIEQSKTKTLNDKLKINDNKLIESKKNYEILDRQKSGLNIKQIGQELENWIENEYAKNSFSFADSTLTKTSKSILGTKPDFQFIIYDENHHQICNLIIEVKTQSDYSANSPKLKNQNHLEKLAIDANNFNADYAILVSELEMKKDDFLIKKVTNNNFKNIFIIRPHYFISFLNLMRFFALKRKQIDKLDIKLQDKQTILSEFHIFKTSIFKSFNNNIKNGTEKILRSAEDIKKKAIMIEREAITILEDTLVKLGSRIARYSIEDKVKSLKKIELN